MVALWMYAYEQIFRRRFVKGSVYYLLFSSQVVQEYSLLHGGSDTHKIGKFKCEKRWAIVQRAGQGWVKAWPI